MAQSSLSPKKDLAVRESILGVLNTKDKSGKGSLPISEFDKVVTAFGLSWEHQAVRNVLDHCKMESGDMINFSSLKNELAQEKKRLTAKPIMRHSRNPLVQVATIATPKVSGILKEQRALMKERQERMVKEQVSNVHTVYKMLANHDINKTTAVNLLRQQNIYPTKELIKVASEMETGEVSFADFNKSLTASEPYPRVNSIFDAQTNSGFAGAIRPSTLDRFVSEDAIPGKKLFEIPPSQVAVVSNEELELEPIKPAKRFTGLNKAKMNVMGALFNETGKSKLGQPEYIDWTYLSPGRRHHIQEEDNYIDIPLARGQLDHGDCVSWRTGESELELRNAVEVKLTGKKVDDMMVVVNHLSNVISWDNFRGQQYIDHDEIVRREMSMSGGLSVATGNRNATSQRNILAWEDSHSPSPTTSHLTGNKYSVNSSIKSSVSPTQQFQSSSAGVLNIGEYSRSTPPNATRDDNRNGTSSFAGSPSLRIERPMLRKSASFSYLSKSSTPPFGTDKDSGSPGNSALYGRGRTPTGTRFGPEGGSPSAFTDVSAGGYTRR